MKLDRILVIAKKKFRSLRHDRRTAGFIFVVPFIMILVFGYTFGGDVKNISVYVVNLDEGFGDQSLYWKIIDELNESDTFSIIQIYTVEDVSSDPVNLTIDEVRSAKVWATIIFDESFTRNAISNIISLCLGRSFSPSNMTMYIDGTNPNVAASIVRGVTESLQALLIEEYHMTLPVRNRDGDDIWRRYGVHRFLCTRRYGTRRPPGYVHAHDSDVREGEIDVYSRKTIDHACNQSGIVLGYALSFGLVALAQSTVILLTGMLLFNIQIIGSPILTLLIIYVLGVVSMGISLMFSSIAKNELQAVQFTPLIYIPSILLAGIFWPVEAIPEFLRPIYYFIPLTYAVDGCRSVMIRGWGAEEVLAQLIILILFAVAMLLLSTFMLKRRR